MHYRTNKLLSVDPSSYKDAPTEGIRRILEEETGISHPRGQLVDTSRILSIRMGTTVNLLSHPVTALPACGYLGGKLRHSAHKQLCQSV